MTTVRDEVHQLVSSAMEVAWDVGVGNRSVSEGIQVRTQTTDAITNLVWGAKELEWGGIDYPYAKVAEFGYGYGIGEEEGTFWVSIEDASFPNPLIAQTFPTLEAAKAACQADYANRTQSALTAKPAPVVSDESGAFKAFKDAAHELAGYADNLIERTLGTDKERIAPEWDTLFFGLAKANENLPASHTEADIRAEERERLCKVLTPSCETKAAFMGKFSFLIDELDEGRDVRPRKITVPWDTIKEIMAAIRALSQGEGK